MRAHTYLTLLVAASFACQPADTSASANAAIDAANAQWPRLTSTGHADSIAEFYAADAVIMPPNMATMKGKDAIKAFFATMNTMDPKPILTLHADAVHGTGAMAMERGRWHWAYAARPGATGSLVVTRGATTIFVAPLQHLRSHLNPSAARPPQGNCPHDTGYG